MRERLIIQGVVPAAQPSRFTISCTTEAMFGVERSSWAFTLGSGCQVTACAVGARDEMSKAASEGAAGVAEASPKMLIVQSASDWPGLTSSTSNRM